MIEQPQYTDLYLKSPDKASLIADLKSLNYGFVIQDDEGEDILCVNGKGFALDYIGNILETPGTYDEETGEELTAPVFTPEVHANIRAFSIPKRTGIIHRAYDDTMDTVVALFDTPSFANGTLVIDQPSNPVRRFA